MGEVGVVEERWLDSDNAAPVSLTSGGCGTVGDGAEGADGGELLPTCSTRGDGDVGDAGNGEESGAFGAALGKAGGVGTRGTACMGAGAGSLDAPSGLVLIGKEANGPASEKAVWPTGAVGVNAGVGGATVGKVYIGGGGTNVDLGAGGGATSTARGKAAAGAGAGV